MATREEIIKILQEKNVEIKVEACGCCQGPWVTLQVDGVLLWNDEVYAVINTFKEESDARIT